MTDQRNGISRHIEQFARPVIGALGLVLIVFGAWAVFNSESHAAGAVALLGFGSALLVLAGLLDRLESLRIGDLVIVLRREAQAAAVRGDPESAEALQQAADTLARRVEGVAHSYQSVRSSMPAGEARTNEMEGVIAKAREDAKASDVDADEVLARLWAGSEGTRVWALGVLQARPELATTRAILESVTRPDNMFDQYHALKLAEHFVQLPGTRTWQRERIGDAVRQLMARKALGSDADCLARAQVVSRLASVPAPVSAAAPPA